MKKIVNWLTEKEIKSLYTSDYWNDVEIEKQKDWWIADGNYEKCLNHLKSSKLLYEFDNAKQYINEKGGSLKVLDIAAGIGWTSVLISKISNVKEVHAVEMSKHRIGILFEHSMKMLEGIESKVFRYLGNFYNLKLKDNSVDVVFMSQAFHHADKPLKLLLECDRVLKSNGRMILVGEPIINFKMLIRRFLSRLMKKRKFTLNFFELFPPEAVGGDHYYRKSDYYFLFQTIGYSVKHLVLENDSVIYIADKN